jgi:hypothetical protein
MKRLWGALFNEISQVVGLSDARRLTNFVLGASLAQPGETLGTPSHLAAQVRRLIAEVGAELAVDSLDWSRLLQVFGSVELVAPSPPDLDGWVEVFQAADGSRKSLGAFATPGPFADTLADALVGAKPPSGDFRVIDPAAGAGSLLLAVYRRLVRGGCDPFTAMASLHGMELDPAARELCILHLWLTAPSPKPPIGHIASRIILGNALTRDWWTGQSLFDGVIMNPPWESLRHAASCETVENERLITLERLSKPRTGGEGLPPLYTAHGRGDRNLFKAFVELAPHLLKPSGRLSALLPAAFASDDGMSDLRRLYASHLSIEKWTTYENRGRYFAIDSRYKFGLLDACRADAGTSQFLLRSFSTHPEEVRASHISIDLAELRTMFGSDVMIPEFTHERERDILKRMGVNGRALLGEGPLGRVTYRREVDLTLGRAAGRFIHVDDCAAGRQGEGLFAGSTTEELVPVVEGRMVGQYDCFQKSFVGGSGRTAVWQENAQRALHECRPQFLAPAQKSRSGRVAVCDVTSATNTRTMIATLVPDGWLCGNTAPVLQFETEDLALAGLAVLNSLTFDWMTRRVISGLHLNKFYLAHLRWPKLTAGMVSRLSELARAVLEGSPRGGLRPSTAKGSPAERLEALSEIESLLIEAYDLELADVAFMLADDRADRRGFWRYYDSSAEGRELRSRVLKQLEADELLAA